MKLSKTLLLKHFQKLLQQRGWKAYLQQHVEDACETMSSTKVEGAMPLVHEWAAALLLS